MKQIVISIIFVTALIAGSINTSFAQAPEQLYQKGLVKEEGEGALQDAISLYKQVADNSKADQSLRAKALLHIGMCHEKLGTQEAIKTYQRLVASFPAQKNEVAVARERLSRLIHIAEEVSKTHVEPIFTMIQTPVGLARGAQLSPDGKKLTFSSTMYEGSIWILPFPGKVAPDIAGKPEKLVGEDNVWIWGHAWSADGRWIAYNYMKNENTIFVDEVHVISSSGGEPVRLAVPVNRGGGYHLFQYCLSLSPDGKFLAYSSKEEGESDKPKESFIYTIPVSGGAARRLTCGGTWLPAFSPDGRKIAYIKNSEEEDELWVIPAQGGTPVKVCDLGGKAWGPLTWSPKSDLIAYLREPKPDDKSKEIWLATVPETGSYSSPPQRIELSLEPSINLAGWTNDNKIGIFMLSPVYQAIYTIPSSGGKATQVTPLRDIAFSPCWNPDGKTIYFASDNNYASVASEGGEISAIPVAGIDQVNFPVVSPDGKRVLFHGYKKGVTGMHIWTAPIEGGEPTQVIKGTFKDDFIEDAFPRWSPDGKTISFWRHEKTSNGNSVKSSICLVPAEGGDVRVLISDQEKLKEINPRSMCWSPDGKSIVFYCNKDGKIKTIPIDNGEPQVLAELKKGTEAMWISFLPGGEKILYTADNKMWKISLNGGEPVEIITGLDIPPAGPPASSPDGGEIAFTIRKGGEINLWMMDNFLPFEKLQQENEKKELLIRKALANTDIEPLGSASPDGRYISFIDWNSGGNVGILNLDTKERRLLTDFNDPNEQAYYSSWSPDGKQIAYFWWRYDKDQYNLSIVDVEKAESRVLFISDKNNWIELGNWSSDGKYIFATLSLTDEPKSQIIRVSAADGTKNVLKTCDESYTGGKPYVSPDNRFVAYDLPDKNASGNSDIYILSLDSGQENTLIKHPSHDYLLGWTPDGKNIMFASDRSGTVDAMTIVVENGKPAGNPKTVKQNIGPVIPLGFTQDGSFYYGHWPNADNIYSAEINFDEGKILSNPTLLIQRFEGRNYSPDYSSDGKFIAYISSRGAINRGVAGRVLCIRNLETGYETEIIPDPEISGRISDPQWSPDDRLIALTCYNKDGYSRIYSYDTQTKELTPLITESEGQPSNIEYRYPVWSKDGKSLFYLQISRYSTTSRIMMRNILTGDDREVYKYSSDDYMDRHFNISLSPDGKWLAAFNRGENRVLKVFSVDGGTVRELYSFKLSGGWPFTQVWSRDGKYIVFPINEEVGGWSLMRIASDGGEIQKIELNLIGINSLSLHPNGRTLAFRSAGYSLPENNIWEMKNFLPSEYNSQQNAISKME